MTTPLFKEALIESKKLREAALEEAKQAVLESISPMIKSILDREIAGGGSVLLVEQDETLPTAVDATPPPVATAPVAPSASGTVIPPEVPSVEPAPIASVGMNVPMPDASGQITVNLADLFNNLPTDGDVSLSTAAAPIAEPTPPVEASPVEEPLTPPGEEGALPVEPTGSPEEVLKESILSIEKKLLESIKSGSVKKIMVRESVQSSLFKAFEALEAVRSQLKVTDATLFESYLNSLYGRLLDSGKNSNSYTERRNKDMATKSLREFAAALFEEVTAQGADAHGSDEGGEQAREEVINSNESDKPSNHAMKASKSTPVADPGRSQLPKSKAENKWPLEESMDEEAMLEQELKEMLDLAEGDEDMDEAMAVPRPGQKRTPEQEKEIDRNLAPKLRVPRPGDKTNRSQQLAIDANLAKKVQTEELDECGMEEDGMSDGEEVEITINVNTPAGTDVDVDGLEGSDSDDMDMMDDMDSDDDDQVLDVDLEGDDEDEDETTKPSPVMEAVRRENIGLKRQLQETQLLTARSLYVNKLFARENLSSGQKRKIVEYLDGARTIQEAKETYGRIKKVLDEAASRLNEGKTLPSRKSGTSSGVTTSGGAQSLNESSNGSQGWWYSTPAQWQFDADRWKTLAGITKKRT